MTFRTNTVSIVVSDVPQEDEEAAAAERRANIGFRERDIAESPYNNWLHFLTSLSDEEREEILEEEEEEERKRMAERYPAGYLDHVYRHSHLLHSLRHYAQQITVPEDAPDGSDRAARSLWWNRRHRLREDALRRIGWALAKGEPVRGDDIKCLSHRDIEHIRAEGDSYLRKVVAEHEQARVRQQDRGRDFGR